MEENETWEEVVRRWNLNEAQEEAALAPIMTREDVTPIWGPAGTGKTKTSMAIVNAAVAIGRKVLVCGPLHKSVDEAMTKLKQFQTFNINMVRFKGNAYAKDWSEEQGDDSGENQQDPTWQMVLWAFIRQVGQRGDTVHNDKAYNKLKFS